MNVKWILDSLHLQ